MSATVNLRIQPYARVSSPNVQGPCSFWSIDFMRRESQQVYVPVIYIHWYLSNGLSSICEKQNTVSSRDRPDLSNLLNCAGFVIGIHHRYKYCLWPDGCFKILKAYQSITI